MTWPAAASTLPLWQQKGLLTRTAEGEEQGPVGRRPGSSGKEGAGRGESRRGSGRERRDGESGEPCLLGKH